MMKILRNSFISVRSYLRRTVTSCSKQGGFGLVETLIAAAILGTTALMLVQSMSSGMMFLGFYKERVIAENIARTQMALTRSPGQEFIAGTASYPAEQQPDDYIVTVTVSEIDPVLSDVLQIITVEVYRFGKQIYVLEGMKAAQ